jgi:hypothetical protein
LAEVIKMYRNKIRLNKPSDVQKLLARIANMLIDDEITEGKARAIGYLCQIMFRGFETIDLQEQINELHGFVKEFEKSSQNGGW